ncbi:glycosyltransferase family 1 protein [Sphingomonas rhizophila]|uniref:Glycosyltransferase family 1 protein n=1 Tax=Sphingomonas rhizophila TaxID=2071607 RepID=A0A7G9SC16_9SPHN|nr:glycosyltransferase family 1 protein [Sphingomonas rhizophila]QNN65391.1 glycosyltransferase family 1 protein [Sphingomonas rhizophila]
MNPDELRIALFSGNYNYVRDGANQALNRLVAYLLRQGAHVRVYSPVVDDPAFPPTGDLVDVPSFPIPGRDEYRVPWRLAGAAQRDLEQFAPNIVHIASPDIVAHRAVSWARRNRIPAVASIHTRFETYLQYYHLEKLEPIIRGILRRLYTRCDAIMAPAPSTAAILRAQRMNRDISIWARGVDRGQFNPQQRSEAFRTAHGFKPDDMVVAFLGRLVLEKGLDVFADAIDAARAQGTSIRVLAIGDGPARPYFEERLPDAEFTGQLTGDALAQALASADVFLNPSVTETFGNVTLEAMACALPVVAAAASGATSLVQHDVTGQLAEPGEIDQYADALTRYASDPALRRKHGAAGLDFARTMDWDEINGAVLKTYKRVIERRRRLEAMR